VCVCVCVCVYVCVCVLRKYWSFSLVTWHLFHCDTFPQIIQSPFFCYIIEKTAIGFGHWSSRATPRTPASIACKSEVHTSFTNERNVSNEISPMTHNKFKKPNFLKYDIYYTVPVTKG